METIVDAQGPDGEAPRFGDFRGLARNWRTSLCLQADFISTVDHPEDVLRSRVGEADKLKVVVPVVRQGLLDWLANDQAAFSHAKAVAEDTAA